MSMVGELSQREDRPAYVRFERRPVEDPSATRAANDGTIKYRDEDYALVTAPYSRDVFEQVAKDWLAQMAVEVRNGRLPASWHERYSENYERWKRGEEMPLSGTPVKGWPVITPGQQKTLIALGILTVEDLAAVNDEGMRRIGMGGGDLRGKAKAWLSQAKDKGPLTMENSTLKAENAALKANNEQLEARVRELATQVDILQRGGLNRQQHFEQPQPRGDGIEVSDILPAEEPAKRQSKRKAADAPI